MQVDANAIVRNAAFPICQRDGDFDVLRLRIKSILNKLDYARRQRLDEKGRPELIPRLLGELANVSSHAMLMGWSLRDCGPRETAGRKTYAWRESRVEMKSRLLNTLDTDDSDAFQPCLKLKVATSDF